jgi:hypothetical protein
MHVVCTFGHFHHAPNYDRGKLGFEFEFEEWRLLMIVIVVIS